MLPVYNEATTLSHTLEEIFSAIVERHQATVFTFVDGSQDGTKEVLRGLQEKYRGLRVSTSEDRKGYPSAAADAILAIDPKEFPLLLFMDSDGQYDPEDFEAIWVHFQSREVDIVKGRRLEWREPLHRRIPSRVLGSMQRILFGVNTQVVTSALRLMRTEVARDLAAKVRHSKYNFWLEFNARALAEGVRVAEVPVRYRRREGSRAYSPSRMPSVLRGETKALALIWLEYHWMQAFSYAMVGTSGALVILAGTWSLVNLLGLHYLLAAAIAIEVSILWAFALNDRWTFRRIRARMPVALRAVSFNVVSLLGLGINLSFLFFFTHFLGIFYLVSEVLAILGTFSFNYLTNLRFTWDGMRLSEDTEPEVP